MTLTYDFGDYEVDPKSQDYIDYMEEEYEVGKASDLIDEYDMVDSINDDPDFHDFLMQRYEDEARDAYTDHTAEDDEKDWERSRL